MFGLAVRKQDIKHDDSVTQLFFDSFSTRVKHVEEQLVDFTGSIARLKQDLDQGRVSDLVLLERLQKLEGHMEESLEWIRKLALWTIDSKNVSKLNVVEPGQLSVHQEIVSKQEVPALNLIVSPSGQVGSIRSLTTPTEMSVLSLLGEQGPKSAPEIGRYVGRSREHTARLMKRLLDEGYVLRDQSRIPYRYSLSERIRQGLSKPSNSSIQKESSRDSKETVSTTLAPV